MAYKIVSANGTIQTFGTIVVPSAAAGVTVANVTMAQQASSVITLLNAAITAGQITLTYVNDSTLATTSASSYPATAAFATQLAAQGPSAALTSVLGSEANATLLAALGNTNGFQQQSSTITRSYQSKLQSWVVATSDYTGTPSQQITAAFNVLLSRPQGGTLLIDGNITLDARVILDCNQNWNAGSLTDAQMQWQLRIACNGSINVPSGMGNGITVRNAYQPVVDLRFEGGGSATDNAFQFQMCRQPEMRLTGINFAGTLFYFNRTTGIVEEMVRGDIWSLNCGQCFSLTGVNSGFGVLGSIWDSGSAAGSTITNMGDVTIEHYESYAATGRTDANLNITNSAPVFIRECTMGMAGAQLLFVQGGASVIIDKLNLYGGTVGQGGPNLVDGIKVLNSNVLVANCYANAVRDAIVANEGSHIQIGNYFGINNSREINMAITGSGSTSCRLTINSAFAQYTIGEYVKCDPALTGGFLNIGSGSFEGGNAALTASLYGINVQTTATSFNVTLGNFLVVGTNYTKALIITNFVQLSCGPGTNLLGGTINSSNISCGLNGSGYITPAPANPLVINTTYTNTLTRPIMVHQPVGIDGTSGPNWAQLWITDPLSNTFMIDQVSNNVAGTATYMLKGIVPGGWSYKVTRNVTTVVPATSTRLLVI